MAGDALLGVASGGAAVGAIPLGGSSSLDIDPLGLVFWLDPSAPINVAGFPVSNVVPASGTWSLSVPVSLPAAAPYAVQFGLLGAGFPGGLGATQAHAGLVSSAVITSYTQGDDAFVTHTLGSAVITFYGTAYSALNIGSNGQITFNTGSTDFTNTSAEFFAGWQASPTASANPGVASFWTDANSGGVASGATYDVIEDAVTGQVQVSFSNQNYWGSNEQMGTHSTTFGIFGNSVIFNFGSLLTATTNTQSAHFGVSNGNDQVGASTDLSDGLGTGISTVQGTYVSAGPDDSICEEVPANLIPASPVYTFLDVGAGVWVVN